MMDTESVGEYDGSCSTRQSHHRHALSMEQLPNMGCRLGQGANVLLTDNYKWGASGSEVLPP